MEFRILGPLEVSAGDGALKVGGPKQRAVLAHLILRANRRVPADLLIDGLWGEEPPETAKNTLQTYVYRLRSCWGRTGSARTSADTCSGPDPRRSTRRGSRRWSGPARRSCSPTRRRPRRRSRRRSRSGAARPCPTCRTSPRCAARSPAFTILEGAQANAPNAYVMDADGGNLVDLSSSLATVVSWTPDGSRIVLSKAGDLVSVKPDGTGERVLLADAPESANLAADYSPDGRWLIMASGLGSSNGRLYLLRLDDEELFLVGTGITPSWRPDVP